MMYWHKVKMIYNGQLSRPVSEAESKNAYAPSHFLHLTEMLWMNSSCLGLCDFVYGFSLPFHKPIHLPF